MQVCGTHRAHCRSWRPCWSWIRAGRWTGAPPRHAPWRRPASLAAPCCCAPHPSSPHAYSWRINHFLSSEFLMPKNIIILLCNMQKICCKCELIECTCIHFPAACCWWFGRWWASTHPGNYDLCRSATHSWSDPVHLVCSHEAMSGYLKRLQRHIYYHCLDIWMIVR